MITAVRITRAAPSFPNLIWKLVALNESAKSFDCPCHGSRFHLDGTVLRGPAAAPLSHLTWKQGSDPNTIEVDGLTLGF